jgi:hypothetical protein
MDKAQSVELLERHGQRAEWRRGNTDLIVKGGASDRNSLSSLAREWLVPLLIREFLAEQQSVPCPFRPLEQKPTSGSIGKERGD